MSPPVIFWFRRDLRLADNLALLDALRRGDGSVVPVFVVDPRLAAAVGPVRRAYLAATLRALDDSLGGALVVLVGEPGLELAAVAESCGAREVVATEDFAPAGRRRDARVRATLGTRRIALHLADSPYAVRPGTVTTRAGSPCKVYTPFRRAWELVEIPGPAPAPSGVQWVSAASAPIEALEAFSAPRPPYFGDLSDAPPALVAAGETAAHAALSEFLGRVDDYDRDRDRPGVAGTSRLSASLHFGAIHPRQVLAALTSTSRGAEVFRSEVCWREFYADVLWHRPDSTWRVLQPSLAQLRVDTDEAAVRRFQTWARGETGFPLVDAGMRQLLAEGWMHNRVRMVTASFLVKHLHLDWRWGASWFLYRLLDADVASNQHGWQWVAGTGTDAAPFHRVFNPTLQAERFDPDGVYVRRYVPELAATTAPQCLQPGGGVGLWAASGYVAPMIDAATERLEALARYAEARSLAATGPSQ